MSPEAIAAWWGAGLSTLLAVAGALRWLRAYFFTVGVRVNYSGPLQHDAQGCVVGGDLHAQVTIHNRTAYTLTVKRIALEWSGGGVWLTEDTLQVGAYDAINHAVRLRKLVDEHEFPRETQMRAIALLATGRKHSSPWLAFPPRSL